MMISVMPFGAFAASVPTTKVAGTTVSGVFESYWLCLEDGTITKDGASAENYNVKYTPATESSDMILVLNNATLSSGITSGEDFVVELIGENKMNIKNSDGIYSSFTLIMIGDGSLDIHAEVTSYYSFHAIKSSSIGILDEVELNISSIGKPAYEKDETSFFGLYAGQNYGSSENTITISDNAKINISSSLGENCTGIFSNKYIYIDESAEININYDGIGEERKGIGFSKGMNVTGNAKINITNNMETVIWSHAISGTGDITINDKAVVSLNSGNAISEETFEEETVALEAKILKVMDNACLTALSGLSKYRSTAISLGYEIKGGDSVEGGLYMEDNAKIVAQAKEGSSSTTGIYAGSIEMKDNSVLDIEVENHLETYTVSNGIRCGTLTATDNIELTVSCNDSNYGTGIHAEKAVNIGNNSKAVILSEEKGLNCEAVTLSETPSVKIAANKYAIYNLNLTKSFDCTINVNTEPTSEGAYEWDGSSALGNYKYFETVPGEGSDTPEEELSLLERIIKAIKDFFGSIAAFFANLFN